ncbi:tetratricopeptide repeat protein [Sulfurimonas sp.]
MKYVVLLILSITLMFADTKADYKKGINLFNKKEYKKSAEIFEKIFYEDISNPKISFYMGRCAYELGDYELAMISYERVLILNGKHLRSRLELARTYIMLKMNEKAKTQLNIVLQSNPPEIVKGNIHKLIAFINNSEKNSFWSYYFSVAAGYDTNINSNPGENVLKDYISTTYNLNRSAITTSDIISSKFTQEVASASNFYRFKKKNLFLESSFMMFAQQYQSHSEYNLVYLALTSAPGTIYNGYKISLPINYSKVYYGAESLLDSNYLQFKIEKRTIYELLAKASMKYERKRYSKESNKARDVETNELELGLDKRIDKHLFRFSYLRAKDNKTNKNTVSYVNRDIDTYSIKYLSSVYDMINLNAQYSFTKYKFEDKATTTDKRVDNFNSYFFSVGKNINKSMSVAAEYKLINNSSNYTPVVYDKRTYNLKLNLSY